MAWIEKRGSTYQIALRHDGRRRRRSLHTDDEREAVNLLNRVERRLRLVEQGDVVLPDDGDLLTYALSDGRQAEQPKRIESISLREIHQRYLDDLPLGSLEASSLKTVATHVKHVGRILGESFDIPRLTHADIQRYINLRSNEKGRRGKLVSPVTIRKELTTLGGIWNWAASRKIVAGTFPNARLRFPKTDERPPFQTMQEIEHRIQTGNVSDDEARDLWDCLYLHRSDIATLLENVSQTARPAWLYLMVLVAAHTGARRGEILRIRVTDIDMSGDTLMIRECKRKRGQRTLRSVPLSTSLKKALKSWSAGSTYLFEQDGDSISVHEASDHLKRTLAGSCWKNVKGWHVFRHSFISNLASQGIDQRMIDAWVGHLAEEMRKRFDSCFPPNTRVYARISEITRPWSISRRLRPGTSKRRLSRPNRCSTVAWRSVI